MSDRLMSRYFSVDTFFANFCHVDMFTLLHPEMLKSTISGNVSAIFDTSMSDISLQPFKSRTLSFFQLAALHLWSQVASLTTSSCLQRLTSRCIKFGQYLLSTSSKASLTHLQPWRDNVLRFDPSCLHT